MEKKTIINKQNIILYLNNNPLGGVIDFGISTDKKTMGIYEILQSDPWTNISGNSNYVITIKQYTDSFQLINNEDYIITCDFNGRTIEFSGCRTKSFNTALDSSGRLVTTTVINAESMVA